MAIVKTNICTGKTLYWYKLNHYPSEPRFIPSPSLGSGEDAGLVIFSALDGVTNTSAVHLLNAATFDEVADASFPSGQWMPFPTHGDYYSTK